MPNRTIYVREDDTQIWEAASNAAGEGNLSNYVTEALRERLGAPKLSDGIERIEVDVSFDNHYGEVSKRKAFYGRWLVHVEEPEDQEWGVAITRKGAFVFYSYPQTQFKVEPRLEDFRSYLDDDAYEMAEAQLAPVEELDI